MQSYLVAVTAVFLFAIIYPHVHTLMQCVHGDAVS